MAGKYLPNTGTTYVRTAIRREKSTDTPPVAPAPVPQVEEPVNYPQAAAPGSCDRCGSIGPHDTDAPVGHPELAWMASVWICGECSYAHEINIAKVEEPATQADPQDMTSEEMWESMSSVNQPTITTSWN